MCERPQREERQKENMMAHTNAQTPSNKMNKNCSLQWCSHANICLVLLFTDGLAHSCVRLQLLVYEYKTQLVAITHAPCISHLLLAAICITIQPASFTACCSHTEAGMRPHARTKSCCITKATGLMYLVQFI